jgi:sugar O-acyltransferase (sialic acid O-acetyltransferase NeuD family)
VAVIGAGGHAKVVISALRSVGHHVAGVFDDNPTTWGASCLGVPVRGPIAAMTLSGYPYAVIAIGSNPIRCELVERLQEVEWLTVVHSSACVDATAQLGAGTVICAGAVIQPDARIGAHVIVNTSASVDHDCQVEDFAHLAPGVHLAGGVHVGRGTFLGIGSVVIPGLRIGEWTTVGAGAVVIHDLSDGVTAIGVPARERELSGSGHLWSGGHESRPAVGGQQSGVGAK